MDTINCACACHLRGDGCKEVVPLRAEIERLRAKLQRLDVVRAAGYEAGVADERARWRWPDRDARR